MNEIDINDTDDIGTEESSDNNHSSFTMSDSFISAVIAAEILTEMVGASPVATIDNTTDIINDVSIVSTVEAENESTLESILQGMGYTIENLGNSNENALSDPMDDSEERSEEAEIATAVNNAPTTSDDNDSHNDGDPMMGQISLFNDSTDTDQNNSLNNDSDVGNSESNEVNTESDIIDGQMSLFDDIEIEGQDCGDNNGDNDSNTNGDGDGDGDGDDS